VTPATLTTRSYVKRERPDPVRRTVERRSQDGTVLGVVEISPEVFGIEPNVAVLHQVVTAQLAAARSGSQSTKTRAEVRGGGAKPFRQKGTGRARQGSTRSPQWVGGGVALGPKPRSYRQRTPKKMIRLALNSALSDRAGEGRIALIDRWTFDPPKTKAALAALAALAVEGRVLVVLTEADGAADRSFANLPEVQTLLAAELNAYDIMRSDWVVFTDETIPGGVGETVTGATPARTPAPKAAPAATLVGTEETATTKGDDHAASVGDAQTESVGDTQTESVRDDADVVDEGSDQ
jgi:large subunit ribosomal protein L4